MTQIELDAINKAAISENIDLYGSIERDEFCRIINVEPTLAPIFPKVGLVDVEMFTYFNANRVWNYYKLNERWRDLRKCRSYEALLKWEEEQQLKQEEKLKMEYILLKSQNEFQKLNNESIKLQQRLMGSQLVTNRINRGTNKLITVFTGVAAALYFYDIFDKLIPNCFTYRYSLIEIATLLFIVLGLIFGLRILLRKEPAIRL